MSCRRPLESQAGVWSAVIASSHSLAEWSWSREGSGTSEFRIGRRKTSFVERSRRPIVNCEVPDPGLPLASELSHDRVLKQIQTTLTKAALKIMSRAPNAGQALHNWPKWSLHQVPCRARPILNSELPDPGLPHAADLSHDRVLKQIQTTRKMAALKIMSRAPNAGQALHNSQLAEMESSPSSMSRSANSEF